MEGKVDKKKRKNREMFIAIEKKCPETKKYFIQAHMNYQFWRV